MIKKLCSNEKLCLCTLVACFTYVTLYGFFADDPTSPDGTASQIGLVHPVLFFFWGLLTAVSAFLNVNYMFARLGGANKASRVLATLAPFLVLATVSVKSHSGDDWPINKIIHWAAALLFALTLILAIFIFFVSKAKKGARFTVTAVVYGAIAVVSLTWLAAVDKNGIIESVPFWASYIIMFVANFTDFFVGVKSPSAN